MAYVCVHVIVMYLYIPMCILYVYLIIMHAHAHINMYVLAYKEQYKQTGQQNYEYQYAAKMLLYIQCTLHTRSECICMYIVYTQDQQI